MIFKGDNLFEVVMKSGQNFAVKYAEQPGPAFNYKPNIIGGSLSFEMDVSSMDCNCVTGAYLV